jgi:hypothetical protein
MADGTFRQGDRQASYTVANGDKTDHIPKVTLVDGAGTAISASAPTGAATVASVNSAATSTTLLAANANRKGAAFVNTDANTLYIDISGGTATTAGVPVASGGYYELPFGITGLITGIWAADGAGVARVWEAS